MRRPQIPKGPRPSSVSCTPQSQIFPKRTRCFPVVRSGIRRKFHEEATATSFFASNGNFCALGRTNCLHDGKAKTSSARVARPRFINPIKPLEHVRKRVKWNSCPVIRYFDNDFAILHAQTYSNRAALLSVFDRIVNEIHEDLLQVRAIAIEVNAIFEFLKLHFLLALKRLSFTIRANSNDRESHGAITMPMRLLKFAHSNSY